MIYDTTSLDFMFVSKFKQKCIYTHFAIIQILDCIMINMYDERNLKECKFELQRGL